MRAFLKFIETRPVQSALGALAATAIVCCGIGFGWVKGWW